MTGFVINAGYIIQKDLRWVDAWDDTVRDNEGMVRETGTWSLFLDTAKYIATTQVEAMLRTAVRNGYDDDASRHRARLAEMRGEGKFDIEMKKEAR